MPRYLVIGSGGREHAIAWKLAAEPGAEVIAAPGNAGIEAIANCRCVEVSPSDHDALVALARNEAVDLTVVGPEAPLCEGIADRFAAESLLLFGPKAAAANLEGSKAFAKAVMSAAAVPTAAYAAFDDLESARQRVREARHPLVIKADGLAAGKGVVLSDSPEQSLETLREFMGERKYGEASTRVVIEEMLTGPELSFMVITDGEHVVPLATSQDHKRLRDGDEGPNTGGMGAISPSPHATAELREQLLGEVVAPVLAELRSRGIEYRGFLYAGVMLTPDGPRVLEFNVRLGDPETQALLFGMRADLGPVLAAAARGELDPAIDLATGRPACCLVLAAHGYPESPRRGDRITGLGAARDEDAVVVFHAGTRREGERIVTQGGRVLGVTARGGSLAEAREAAYVAASEIRFDGMQYRRDIGR